MAQDTPYVNPKRPATKEDVLRLAEDQQIRFILLQFTDILGVVKSVAIPVQRLEKALDGQILFDGSSVHGFVRIEESDMLLKPDPSTYVAFPWLNSGREHTARLICDIYTANDEPFAGCPRLTLKRAIKDAAAMGYAMNAGPEAEFFLFHLDAQGAPTIKTHDQGSYFDLSPVDKGEVARRDMVIALQDLDFDIEAAHHEVAPGQHEIDFRYADVLSTADNMVTLKLVVRTIAAQHGLHATFMPKPVHGINGSGMHVHQSLFQGETNVFDDPQGEYGLSDTCLQYLGGLLHHARGYTAITNPLINSYKRLVPGYEAPVYIAWSERNRSPLIRVPSGRGMSTRLELRSPDPSCNPYLAMAVMLQAGLDGIKKGITPPPPVNRNIYEMTIEERRRLGIGNLPGSLDEAIQELLADEVILQALGDHIVGRFVEAKRIETDVYRTQVHQWELDQYLSVY
ncbi:MAG TPA: type I glutamate--ammonia ligase [Firmicutes bacterium]|nr:type I glutamate--ammonia ligase [Candidatus Fermentithermobacillaceae bacterium]